jgi:hypothetical protein
MNPMTDMITASVMGSHGSSESTCGIVQEGQKVHETRLLTPKASGKLAWLACEPTCYVLDNGQRVLSSRGAYGWLAAKNDGDTRGSKTVWQLRDWAAILDQFANGCKGLQDKLAAWGIGSQEEKPNETLWFNYRPLLECRVKLQGNPRPAHCIDVRVFSELCSWLMEEQACGRLEAKYQQLAHGARRIVLASTSAAIHAMIDEATGYDKVLAHEKKVERLVQPSGKTSEFHRVNDRSFNEAIFSLRKRQCEKDGKRMPDERTGCRRVSQLQGGMATPNTLLLEQGLGTDIHRILIERDRNVHINRTPRIQQVLPPWNAILLMFVRACRRGAIAIDAKGGTYSDWVRMVREKADDQGVASTYDNSPEHMLVEMEDVPPEHMPKLRLVR